MAKKDFKVVEQNAKNTPTGEKDIVWEGEEVTAESQTKIEDDKGTGQEIVLRFFEFAANREAFKYHKPTAMELFSNHLKGIESLLWSDGLRFFEQVQPRLQFSKDKSRYRFIIPCIARVGETFIDKPKTLSQLLNNESFTKNPV